MSGVLTRYQAQLLSLAQGEGYKTAAPDTLKLLHQLRLNSSLKDRVVHIPVDCHSRQY
jgi:hypothetical protein